MAPETLVAANCANTKGGSLGLLHDKKWAAVIQVAAAEISRLLNAAIKGDERAKTVLLEPVMPFCAILSIIACAAMVQYTAITSIGCTMQDYADA